MYNPIKALTLDFPRQGKGEEIKGKGLPARAVIAAISRTASTHMDRSKRLYNGDEEQQDSKLTKRIVLMNYQNSVQLPSLGGHSSPTRIVTLAIVPPTNPNNERESSRKGHPYKRVQIQFKNKVIQIQREQPPGDAYRSTYYESSFKNATNLP